MKRRTYKADLKEMNNTQLQKWINEKTEILLSFYGDGDDANTPLLTKIVYAKQLLKTRTR